MKMPIYHYLPFKAELPKQPRDFASGQLYKKVIYFNCSEQLPDNF